MRKIIIASENDLLLTFIRSNLIRSGDARNILKAERILFFLRYENIFEQLKNEVDPIIICENIFDGNFLGPTIAMASKSISPGCLFISYSNIQTVSPYIDCYFNETGWSPHKRLVKVVMSLSGHTTKESLLRGFPEEVYKIY